LAVNSVTAEKISALSVGADAIQAQAITAEKLAVDAVTANSIQAGAITANAIEVGVIEAFHLAAAVGQSLDISSNTSINLLVGDIASNANAVGAVAGTVQEMGTYYRFDANEATIASGENSAYVLALSSTGIAIRENNVDVSNWDAGQFSVDTVIVKETIQVGNHQIDKSATGTVIRAL
jgi:urease beta subunit